MFKAKQRMAGVLTVLFFLFLSVSMIPAATGLIIGITAVTNVKEAFFLLFLTAILCLPTVTGAVAYCLYKKRMKKPALCFFAWFLVMHVCFWRTTVEYSEQNTTNSQTAEVRK